MRACLCLALLGCALASEAPRRRPHLAVEARRSHDLLAARAKPEPAGLWDRAGAFAKERPGCNSVAIATLKSGAADLLAQAVEGRSLAAVDWRRNLAFCAFGAAYLGLFQFWYQVRLFSRLFPSVAELTSQPWAARVARPRLARKKGLKGSRSRYRNASPGASLRSAASAGHGHKLVGLAHGLASLVGQTLLDLLVLGLVYLPVFYLFTAGVASGAWDVARWVRGGASSYTAHFQRDFAALIRLWAPCDLVCFSVPLHLRLPVRHAISFASTAYLAVAGRGPRRRLS